MQVSWDTVVSEAPAPSSNAVGVGATALSSLAWIPDGSGVAAMDSCGRLALLDSHGAIVLIQSAAQLGHKPSQVAAP